MHKNAVRFTAMVAALGAAVPAPAADLDCRPISITCAGFEPNWQFRIRGANSLAFTDPENPDWQTKPLVVPACARPTGSGTMEITAGAPLELSARISPARCVEPNDRVRPYQVTIGFRQGAQTGNPRAVTGTGCCWR